MSRSLSAMAGVVVVLLMALVAGCGVVGPPIPPEDVGVRATIRKQKAMHGGQPQTSSKKEEAQTDQGALPILPAGQDEELPPLRPVGTR